MRIEQNENQTLQPRRYADAIRTSEVFDESVQSGAENEPRKKRVHRAIAKSALSLAEQRETENGEHDVEASVYRLVSTLDSFYDSSVRLDELREHYKHRHMPDNVKAEFDRNKDTVIAFNDALQDTINTGASKFDFHELLHFMTGMRALSNGPEKLEDFHDRAKESLIGVRNETGFEQLLIYAGVEYRVGTAKEDAKGGDYFINGVPIDVKSSEFNARRTRDSMIQHGYDGSRVVWSHIDFEDFEGKLTLPYEKLEEIWQKLEPELAAATGKQQLAHA